MNFKQLKILINSDLYRLNYTPSTKNILKAIFFNYSYKITFWFRLGSFLQEKKGFIMKCLYRIVFLIYKHNQYLTGIQLPFGTKIGPGLTFGHFSCIVITSSATIGKNCTIYCGCTIGNVWGKSGSPTIGDNVVLYPGAKVVGNVVIGDNVVIGANAVVTKDIPANSVGGGIPAKVISDKGQEYTSLFVKSTLQV